MVAGGVNEDVVVLPPGSLHTHVLNHNALTLKLTVADSNS